MQLNNNYQAVSPEEAVSLVRSNTNIFIHTAAAAPKVLIQALANRSGELRNVNIYQMHTEGGAPYADPEAEGSFRVKNLFVGSNVRGAVNAGRADFIPIFYSDIPRLFRSGRVELDTALLQVSPPDRNGFCTLGVSVETSLAAAQSAKKVIAEINPNMPRTNGDGNIHISKFDRVIDVNYALPEVNLPEPTEVETLIGQYIADLVDDGATLQMGIGNIPNAALKAMRYHKGLGIHTEMFSDGVIDLVERGVITNEHKRGHNGHIVTGFLVGSKRLYDFVDDNPLVRFLDIAYVNDTHVIRQHPKMTAINSAIEVDITGQVCADSIGPRIYSGIGGQMDFMRGAALSEGGKPIIALPSTTKKGLSKISTKLQEGAGVVTTRAHARYIVTEYGIARLFGRSLKERAKALIDIAHPDHRERLAKETYDFWKIMV